MVFMDGICMGYGLGLACAAELLVGYSILEMKVKDLGPSFPCLGLRFSVFVFCFSLSPSLSPCRLLSSGGRQGVAGLAALFAN